APLLFDPNRASADYTDRASFLPVPGLSDAKSRRSEAATRSAPLRLSGGRLLISFSRGAGERPGEQHRTAGASEGSSWRWTSAGGREWAGALHFETLRDVWISKRRDVPPR